MMNSRCLILLILCQWCSAETQWNDADVKVLTGKFDSSLFGELAVNNDNWGNNAGPQSLKAKSGSDWCAECSHGDTGGIKSYPHSQKKVEKPLKSLKIISSSFGGNVTTGHGVLAYSLSYDIWAGKNKYETMLWMQKAGNVDALGPIVQQSLTLGGYTWVVHKGSNGGNEVFSFINTKPTFKGTVDIKAILEYEVQQKWMPEGDAVILDEIQLGYEITSTPPKSSFCLSEFTVTIA